MLQSSTLSPARAAPIGAQEMAEHEMLVRWVVRQQWLGGLPFQDALHERRIGLWAAWRRYDPQRGTAFSTYAVPAIAHAVWCAVANHRHQLPPAPSVASTAADLADLVHQAQIETTLHSLVEQLPPRLHAIIVDHYGLAEQSPKTFAAIARHLGVSRQRIHYLHLKAILWLAHPAHSLPLRLLLERHQRADYQQSMARQRRLARRLRRSPRSSRGQAPSVKQDATAGPKRGGRAR